MIDVFVNYIESWKFLFMIVSYSAAVGFGLALGLSVYEWTNEVIGRLFNLEFKNKDKG